MIDLSFFNKPINFTKLSVVGNHFVLIDCQQQKDVWNILKVDFHPLIIKELCHRTNIGCDQLLIINNQHKNHNITANNPQNSSDENSDEDDNIIMKIFNADGSEVEACGNATIAVAHYLFTNKLNDLISETDFNNKLRSIKINTVVDSLICTPIINSKKALEGVSVLFTKPNFQPLSIPIDTKYITSSDNISIFNHSFFAVNVGNPHLVCFIDREISDNEFFSIAPEIEKHQYFPKKINVEFAQVINDAEIAVRVWERGCGETLACGSGACAVASVAIRHKVVNTESLTIRFKGGDVKINWSGNTADKISMINNAKNIFSGDINVKWLQDHIKFIKKHR
jgi:diaminopimelate epimerase